MSDLPKVRPEFLVGFRREPKRKRERCAYRQALDEIEVKDAPVLERPALPLPIVKVTRAELEQMPTFRKHW
jgi:hypothetical protein